MSQIFAAYFDSDNALTAILWPIFLGILLAFAISFAVNLTVGKFCRRLFAEEADCPARAKTLAELGCAKSPLLRFALRRGSTLRKVLTLLPADAPATPAAEAENASETAETDTAPTEDAENAKPARTVDKALLAERENGRLAADFARDRWYLTPSAIERADTLYNKNAPSPFVIATGVVLLAALIPAAFYLIPIIADLLAGIFGA